MESISERDAEKKRRKAEYDKKRHARLGDLKRAQNNAYAAAHRAGKAEYDRRYRAANREKLIAAKRRYYAERREVQAAKARARYRANPAKFKALTRDWQRKNRARVNSRQAAWRNCNRDKCRKRVRDFKKRHPERVAADQHLRRARQLKAAVGDRKLYRAFVKRVRDAVRIACYWCGKNVPKSKRHIDHIISLADRGADSVSNLCCSCAGCNQRKGDRRPEVFSGQFVIEFKPI